MPLPNIMAFFTSYNHCWITSIIVIRSSSFEKKYVIGTYFWFVMFSSLDSSFIDVAGSKGTRILDIRSTSKRKRFNSPLVYMYPYHLKVRKLKTLLILHNTVVCCSALLQGYFLFDFWRRRRNNKIVDSVQN